MPALNVLRRWLKRVLFRDETEHAAKPLSINGFARRAEEPTDVESVVQLAPYDEQLFERSRTQWQFGDWASLAGVSHGALVHHPERARLALLVAAGHQGMGNAAEARQFARLALDWGCSKKIVSQVLISGVHHSLAKVAFLLGNDQTALSHYKTAATISGNKGNSTLIAETIASREAIRLGRNPQATSFLTVPTTQSPEAPTPPTVGITSYAQNFEDVMLWRALGRVENGFYIDIGAQDPTLDSVSKAFYEHGWRGIHVEPVARFAEALRQDRPDERVIEAVVAAAPGIRCLYQIAETGLSTCAEQHAARHRSAGWKVEQITVTAITLSDLLAEAGRREVHWLKVDVEGMEDEVFDGWGIHSARPWIIVVEATEPGTQKQSWHHWEHRLLARDYSYAYFDGLNRFYVHAAHRELGSLLRTPPNVFDGFQKAKPIGLSPQ